MKFKKHFWLNYPYCLRVSNDQPWICIDIQIFIKSPAFQILPKVIKLYILFVYFWSIVKQILKAWFLIFSSFSDPRKKCLFTLFHRWGKQSTKAVSGVLRLAWLVSGWDLEETLECWCGPSAYSCWTPSYCPVMCAILLGTTGKLSLSSSWLSFLPPLCSHHLQDKCYSSSEPHSGVSHSCRGLQAQDCSLCLRSPEQFFLPASSRHAWKITQLTFP